MDIAMNFTLGLSQGIAWPWPIAVYLFLAGISGGAVAVALMLNRYRNQVAENTPVLKAATLVGFVTIVLGMICLVADLTNPLVFWRILIYYNLTSVMSLGVIALLFYIPLVFVLMLVAFRKEVKGCGALAWLDGIIGAFDGIRGALQWIVLILAITICAYTGFLISALIRFPLINTAVLPALFIASGLSAGAAAAKLVAVGCFGGRMARDGGRGALHLHDRGLPDLRQRRCSGCRRGLCLGYLVHRVLGRCRRRRLRAARAAELRQEHRELLPRRSLQRRRHALPASLHPVRRSDLRSLMSLAVI